VLTGAFRPSPWWTASLFYTSVLIHVVSILPVMLSEAKYLFISFGFWRIEILHFVQDDRRRTLCLVFKSGANCESIH